MGRPHLSPLPLIGLALYLGSTAKAYTAFDTSCTLPNSTVNYVSSPNTRGSTDIAWSSWATLIACTYSILHLNLPLREDNDRYIVRWLRKWVPPYRSILLTVLTIFAPEYVWTEGIGDWMEARKQLRALHRSVPDTQDKWSLTHMFYANMGGFVLLHRQSIEDTVAKYFVRSEEVGVEERPTDDDKQAESVQPIALSPLGVREEYHQFHLNGLLFRAAVDEGILSADVPAKEEISDRSKSDWFAKLLVVLQLIDFYVNTVARAVEGLPIAPLEVAVSGYGVCSIVLYVFMLSKPQDVETTIPLATYDEIPKRLIVMGARLRAGDHPVESDGRYVSYYSYLKAGRPTSEWVGTRTTWKDRNEHIVQMFITIITATIFGGIHLAAWNLHFPTEVDRWLWRGAAIAATAVPYVFAVWASLRVGFGEKPRASPFDRGVLMVIIGFYGLSRAILLVEMIRTLFFLPPQAYNTPSWPLSIPHIS